MSPRWSCSGVLSRRTSHSVPHRAHPRVVEPDGPAPRPAGKPHATTTAQDSSVLHEGLPAAVDRPPEPGEKRDVIGKGSSAPRRSHAGGRGISPDFPSALPHTPGAPRRESSSIAAERCALTDIPPRTRGGRAHRANVGGSGCATAGLRAGDDPGTYTGSSRPGCAAGCGDGRRSGTAALPRVDKRWTTDDRRRSPRSSGRLNGARAAQSPVRGARWGSGARGSRGGSGPPGSG